MEIFHTNGWFGIFRMAHVFAAVMWMGLLWFFNFVQTPAYAEMEAGSRNDALDKLTWRALWWFRWAAAATVLFGILLLMLGSMAKDTIGQYNSKAFWLHSAGGPTLLVAILFALTMLGNVWLVIWPKQQVVIANARTLKAGGEANPAAAAAGRAGAMASRQNTIFSLPVLVLMVGVSHFWGSPAINRTPISSSKSVIFILIGVAILVVMELNALGKISGRGNTGMNVLYETHKNAIYAGSGLIVLLYVVGEFLLRH